MFRALSHRLCRTFILATFAFLLAGLVDRSTHAATDPHATAPNAAARELVVLEVPGCIYCRVFRRDVLPAYEASPRARDLPIRFVDLNDPAADALKFSQPITIVPTVVLVEGNREVSRIPGYVGRANFFRMVKSMMATY